MAKRTLRDRRNGLVGGILAPVLCVGFIVLTNVFGLVDPVEPGPWSYWLVAIGGALVGIGIIVGVGLVAATLVQWGMAALARLVRRWRPPGGRGGG